MKKFWKALALVGCALLLVVASVAGTYAILTSKTATVSNTFTAGNVQITLDETDYDVYGLNKETDDRVTTNEYKLIPGHTYLKDPTIHVTKESEVCYLFVRVVDGLVDIQDANATVAASMTAAGWAPLEVDEATVENVWVYNQKVDARTEAKDIPVFTTFAIKQDANVAGYTGKTIQVTAYAAQADGFATADLAWKAAGNAFN